MRPITQVGLGVVLSVSALALAWACSGAQRIPAVVACQVEALKILPDDPMMATVYDAVDLIHRIRACHRHHPDAGAP